jgi:hypothetical protein
MTAVKPSEEGFITAKRGVIIAAEKLSEGAPHYTPQ